MKITALKNEAYIGFRADPLPLIIAFSPPNRPPQYSTTRCRSSGAIFMMKGSGGEGVVVAEVRDTEGEKQTSGLRNGL